MSNDVEMQQTEIDNLIPNKLYSGDETKKSEEINGIMKDDSEKSLLKSTEFTGLTKEDLEKFAKDPFWRRLRLALFILFWLIWIGMLVAAILVVVLSPKCPKREKLEFWQKKTGYWVDALSFVDSNNDGVGDFEGLMSKLDYIEKEVKAGYIVLDPIFKGQYTNKKETIGLVDDFSEIDPVFGSKTNMTNLFKECRKRGIEVVLAIDINALAPDSKLLTDVRYDTVNSDSSMSWVNRNGELAFTDYKGVKAYSVFPGLIDLNLANDKVKEEIKKSIKQWLELGAMGFLLTNVPLYMENRTYQSTETNIQNTSNLWYQKALYGQQLFNPTSLNLLAEIKTVFDEVTKKTDKQRVLMVEAGNIGIGLSNNSTDEFIRMLLLNQTIVDMVISREFLSNRGWSNSSLNTVKSSITNYLTYTYGLRNRVGVTSATSTSIRTNDLLKVAAPFLVGGNPIIYFGTEIGGGCNEVNIKSLESKFYPKNRQFAMQIPMESSIKCNHMAMPWDKTGSIFNSGKVNDSDSYFSNLEETYETVTAVGRGATLFQVHQKLAELRSKEPSLLWGTSNCISCKDDIQIIVRDAAGFSKIIVVFMAPKAANTVYSFSSSVSGCDKVEPKVVYPPNDNLPEEKEVDTKSVYLQNDLKTGSLHVFKCVQ